MELMKTVIEINRMIADAEEELAQLEARRSTILETIKKLSEEKDLVNRSYSLTSKINENAPVTNQSPEADKISLFRKIFKVREDVYSRRFESHKTGKAGYQPACRNEWIRGVCNKPRIRCSKCDNRELLPLTDEVIRCHLLGSDPKKKAEKDFTIGIYPLSSDETCWFIIVDFDKTTWMEDAKAFLGTCKSYGIPASLER
jgi:hypothetical protein